MSNNLFEGETYLEAGVDKPSPFEGIRGVESGDKPNFNIRGVRAKRNKLRPPRLTPDLSGKRSDQRMGGDLGGIGTMLAGGGIGTAILIGLIILF